MDVPGFDFLTGAGLCDEVAALESIGGNPNPEFYSTPAPTTRITFTDTPVGASSNIQVITIENLGGAPLTISCALSGTNPSSFDVDTCPSTIPASSSGELLIKCTPDSLGLREASLDLSTNDADEGNVNYGLSCRGVSSDTLNNELRNISTRADIGNAQAVAVAGFIISGDTEMCVVVRGRGQSVNVNQTLLENPTLTLKSGSTTIEFNDDWQEHPTWATVQALG